MKKLICIFLALAFLSCNKDNFDKEHSQHIVGKWKWVMTEVYQNQSLNIIQGVYTPTSTNSSLEIEFKKNGTTKFYNNNEVDRRYLENSSDLLLNQFFEANSTEPYYAISTSFTKVINYQKNFANFIPLANSDSLYSGFFPQAVLDSEGAIESYYAKSIFIRID